MLDEKGDVEFQIIAGELCLDFVNSLLDSLLDFSM